MENQHEFHDHAQLDIPPPMLAADDAPDQSDVINNLYQIPAGYDLYDKELVGNVNLSQLKSAYENDRVRYALNSLNKRRNITIDPDYEIHADNPNVSWNANSNYLDLLACVGRELGLDAFVPNQESNHNYEFLLNLKEPFRQFKGKHIRLGFDSTAAMLWIGKSRGHEDVWIAMADEEKHEQGIENDRKGQVTTSMSSRHYRQMVYMFAFMLREMGYEGVTLRTNYPKVDNDEPIIANTNLL
jgi:hypothetical protein